MLQFSRNNCPFDLVLQAANLPVAGAQWAHGQWASRENNALELASQSTRYIDYKKITYNMMLAIALLKHHIEPIRGNRLFTGPIIFKTL